MNITITPFLVEGMEKRFFLLFVNMPPKEPGKLIFKITNCDLREWRIKNEYCNNTHPC